MSRLHSTSMTRCWLLCCSILVLLPAACSPAPSSPISPVQSVTKATQEPMQSQPTCYPSPIMPTQVGQGTAGLPEIRGTASGGEMWALVFNTVPLPIKQEVKIVWRMTGSGDVLLQLSRIVTAQIALKSDAESVSRLIEQRESTQSS